MSSSTKDHNAFKFASREDYAVHLLRRKPTSEEFCTDSLLESSRIPTPSPGKKKPRSAFESKPRRAIGNTRTLKAAWEATANNNQPSSSESEAPLSRGNLKPLPTQARRTRKKKGQNPPLKSFSTPSPPQREQDSPNVISPYALPSSPPQDLEETYRRIAEEQELTEHEWIEEYTDSSGSAVDVGDQVRGRVSSRRGSPSSQSFRGSRRSTPQPRTADSNKENEVGNTGVVTDATDLSFLQNMTDQDLAAKLTPHTLNKARDRARLDKAVQQPAALAFSKALVGSKHNLPWEILAESNDTEGARSVKTSSDGSVHNENITPPPNVPRTWGSKGRVDRDWLRKITDGSGSPTSQGSTREKEKQSHFESPAPADVPLPSTEGSSTLLSEGLKRSTPGSRKSTPMGLSKQTSLDRIRQWDFDDITGHNLSVSSSPPVRVKNKVLNHSRDREIEALEKSAVTTNRLGEIVKKHSSGLSAGKSRRFSEGAQGLADDRTSTAMIDVIPETAEGEPIPSTPIVVFKGSTLQTEEEKSSTNDKVQDSKDTLADLQKLARVVSESPKPDFLSEKLSSKGQQVMQSTRAAKDQPIGAHRFSPVKLPNTALHDTRTPPVKRSKSADFARTPTVAGAWVDTLLPETARQTIAPSKYVRTPHVTGGWIDTPVVARKDRPSLAAPFQHVDPTRALAHESTSQGSKDLQHVETHSKGDTREALTLPHSALTSLLTRAKRKLVVSEDEYDDDDRGDDTGCSTKENDTLNLGDATIESLEGLLTLDREEMSTLIRLGDEIQAREKKRLGQLEQAVKEQRQHQQPQNQLTFSDDDFIGRLGPRLQNICTNIHDVRKGITALEHQLSQPQANQVKAQNDNDTNSNFHPCHACGYPRPDSISAPPPPLHSLLSTTPPSSCRLYLTLPIPQLYHYPRRTSHQRHRYQHLIPRPTLFGWLLLLVWLWYTAESVLCSWYCHPAYAEWYVWPVDPDGVNEYYSSMPGTIPPSSAVGATGRCGMPGSQLEWGWMVGGCAKHYFYRLLGLGHGGGRLGGVLWVVVRAVVRWVALVLGWSDGFVGPVGDDGSMGPSPGPNPGLGVEVGAGDAGLDGLSGMEEDEFL